MKSKNYIEKPLLIFLVLFFPLLSFSQKITKEYAEEFIKQLIYDKEDLDSFIDSSEINISNRLGIKYENVSKKYMISYDIDENVKTKIIEKELDYKISIQPLDVIYSKIIFKVPQLNYRKGFYFKDKGLISPVSYYTRNWNRIESSHFIFVISDTMFFNRYCVDNLEKYFLKMSTLLNLSQLQRDNIKSEKIYYYLCKNECEIKQLTGFTTRGMYIPAFDYIVTTFNAHYHELLHLLINYKLQNLPLYTQPFFQEGFAVAFGGRGGKEPNIILNLGLFLVQSNFLDYASLLSKKDFYQYDVSLSYPVSGLYNLFLINKIGILQYLKIYEKYSGLSQKINTTKVSQKILPEYLNWQAFLDSSKFCSISFEKPKSKLSLVFKNKSVNIFEDSVKYYFELKDTLLIKTVEEPTKYKSKKFFEIFPNRKYNGEKYIIIINESELSIYNLFTNNLIESFAVSFSQEFSSIPNKNGIFMFSISKDRFDENLKEECIFYK